MRENRWSWRDFEPEPGDMVRISAARPIGVWAEVAVGAGEEEKELPIWIPSGPGPESQAMFLGEEDSEGFRIAQVLHGGRILNVLASDIDPVD